MKKLFTVMLIAILAMSTVFADTSSSGENVSGQALTTISLKIAEGEVNMHNIGFTSDSNPSLSYGATPAALTSIDLTYKRGETTESTTGNYVYYYFESSADPVLTLTAGSGLTSTDASSEETINYTLAVGESESTSQTQQPITLATEPRVNGVSSGVIGFSVTVTSTITADMVATDWTDTITLKIAAAE